MPTPTWRRQRKKPLNHLRRETPKPKSGERWGILGGAFDPIHHGHLNLAEQIQKECKLNGVLFVPSAHPPHRDSDALTAFEVRCHLIELALAHFRTFALSLIESDPHLSGFTIDTLQALGDLYPGTEFDLIVGADQARLLDTWRKPHELLNLTKVLIGGRPGFPVVIPDGLDRSRIELIAIDPVNISASDIRRLVSKGISESDLSALVPQAVASYIAKNRLYRQ